MARKAKKGKHTIFYSLEIYTHLHTHTHTVFMAPLRTHSPFKIYPRHICPTTRVFSFSLFDENGLEIPKPILILYAHLGYTFCCFGWAHVFVSMSKKSPFCLWDKGFWGHPFPSQPRVLLVFVHLHSPLWVYHLMTGPSLWWTESSINTLSPLSKRKHLWHFDEVLWWLRASR